MPPDPKPAAESGQELTPRADDRPFLRRMAMVVGALAAVVLLWKLTDTLLLAFGALLVALLLAAAADWLAARTPLTRGIALGLATVLFLLVVGLIGWLFGTETAGQFQALRQTLPQHWATLKHSLEADPLGQMLVGSLGQGAGGSRMAGYALGASWGASEALANFLIILVGGVFFAAQPGRYRRGLVLLTPPPWRAAVDPALGNVARALRLWLVTQLASMLLMGIMIGLGLWWSGTGSPAALGLLGGLSEFIPYVGPTLAMIPAIIVGLAGSGSIWGVLLTYLVVRIVQANLITPLISQRLVSVPPGLYLFLILAAGRVFGVFGLFFAGALAVAGYTLATQLLVRETYGDAVTVPGEP